MTETTGIRSRTVTANGLRMHVTEAGAGEPVVFLHGFPESSREWAPVMARLADRVHAIAPDLRGAGQTEAPASGYDLATVARDVIALLDELGFDQVDLVAHDWGAFVGFELCLADPSRIRRYVALSVPAPYLRLTPGLLAALARALPHLWFQWAIAIPGLGPWLLSHGRQRVALGIIRNFSVRPLADADVAAYTESLRDPARSRAASQLYRNLILPTFMKVLRGGYRGRVLHTPTLVLFGVDDGLLAKEHMTVTPEEAPRTTLDFIPGGGHYVVDDVPDEVSRRIADFLLA